MPPTRSARTSRLRRQSPCEAIEISDDEDTRPSKSTRTRRRLQQPIYIDLSELSDDDIEKATVIGAADVDDGAPFPMPLKPLPRPPSYEQTHANVEPRMRALGAPDWAVDVAAGLNFNMEMKLGFETCQQLDRALKASLNVTHAFSSINRARGDGEKEHYVLCPFRNGKYPACKPYNLRSILTARDLDYLTMRDLRWYITGYGHPVPDTRAERLRLLRKILGINVISQP